MVYNNLYNGKFYIIDHNEYYYSSDDVSKIEKNNNNNFDLEIYLFLVENYFSNVVKNNKLLNELYRSKKDDVLIFIKELRKYLSELTGEDIKYLKKAKQYMDSKKTSNTYQRLILK